MRALSCIAAIGLALICSRALCAEDETLSNKPVKVVADARLSVGGRGILPLYLSSDWSMPLPAVSRAVILLHGRLRNADEYYISAHAAQVAAGDDGKRALMIVPQFLAEVDIEAHKLPADMLRWSLLGWEGGDAALVPNPVSSFEALDAILAKLSDRRIFPNLKQVVVAGHSGGAQVVQRYAIAGKGEAALLRQHIEIRYVVANPSSYAYFSAERPVPAIAASCRGYDVWKYAWANGRLISRMRHLRRSSSAMSSGR